jgi:hypothetical protein
VILNEVFVSKGLLYIAKEQKINKSTITLFFILIEVLNQILVDRD